MILLVTVAVLDTIYAQWFRAVQGSYLGLRGEHVVPQDGGPAAGQLADVGDDHHWQRQRLSTHTVFSPTDYGTGTGTGSWTSL